MYLHSKTFGQCLWVTLFFILGGCASSSSTSNASKASNVPLAKLYAENQWHMRLESDDKAETSEPFEVNGRRMVLKKVRFNPMQLQPDGTVMKRHVAYYGQLRIENIHIRSASALLDADTGQAILPMDYARIVPIPGHGVYVMPGKELARDVDSWIEHKKWSELDVATGELKPSKILDIFVLPPDSRQKSNGLVWDLQKRAVGILTDDPASTSALPLVQIQVFPAPASGVESYTYTRVKAQNRYGNAFFAGRYLKMDRVGTNGANTTVLLDSDGTFCLETDQNVAVFRYRRSANNPHEFFTTLAIPAPGTDEMDDLWLILDDSGRFGAPTGSLGFRPIYEYRPTGESTGGRAIGWLVRFAAEGENDVKWEAIGAEFKPLNGHRRYTEAVIFDSLWFYPPQNKYDKGDTRKRHFLAIRTPGGIWELHAGNNPPDLMSTYRNPLLTGKSLVQLQSDLEAKLQKDLIAYAAYEKAKAEAERKARVAALQRDFQNAIRNKSWSTAEGLAGQLGGDAYYTLARSMPNPTVLFLQRAMERTSSQIYKNDLKKMTVEAKANYERQLAAHQNWQQQQNSRRTFTGGGAVSSYSPKASPPKTMAQYMHDHAQAARYKDNSSYSQHKVNMGWYRPSGY